MTHDQPDAFDELVKTIAFKTPGPYPVKYFALNEDELALYFTPTRVDSPGVIVLHRDGTYRYDPNLPERDPMVVAKRRV